MITVKAVRLCHYLSNSLSLDAVDIETIKINEACQLGEVLLKVLYLSIDPYIRNRLTPGRTKYISTLKPGSSLVSLGVGVVIKSNSKYLQEGDHVRGMLSWQSLVKINDIKLNKIAADKLFTVRDYLGLIGYSSFTAYVGIELAKLVKKQTVFVSSAAGAVGSIAGQLAKLKGCYVVGTAGSDNKVEYLVNTLNFDQAFNYKNSTLDIELANTCPNGIDVNFENVGGVILESAISHLNPRGKIILSGMISQYNSNNPFQGPTNIRIVQEKHVQIIPYIVTDYDHLYPKFVDDIRSYYENDLLYYHQNIIEGLDNAWSALVDLFSGLYTGKVLISLD